MTDPRLMLFDKGYTDLVSVAPPGVEISPNSGLKADDLGKRPGKQGRQGWYGYSWMTDQPSRADIERWAEWGSNVGLRGTRFPALDIDSTDEMLTRVVMKIAREELGDAPLRIGKPPKSLMVYRAEDPFSRVAVEVKRGGETHLVEFLGHGRQYLVYGEHPTAGDYEWVGDPLWQMDPSQLAQIGAEDVERFLTVLEEKLVGVGLEVKRVGRASAVSSKAEVEQEALLAPSMEALNEVVSRIPNDGSFDDRDDYVQMGIAIKAAAGPDNEEDGYLIFSTWAARWENGTNDPETVRGDWRRMHPPFRVGYGWLRDQAPDDFNDAVYEFEAVPGAEPPPVQSESRDPDLPAPVDCTDDWITEKVSPELSGLLRYDYANGRWHVWDGTRWAVDERGEHERQTLLALRRLARKMRERIATMPKKSKERAEYTRMIAGLGNVGRLRAVVSLLESKLAVGTDAFDAELMELNTPAGIVDLTTGEIRAHDPAQMHSKSTAVAPSLGAASRWKQFLHEVTAGDEELERFLQKTAGYALTGVRREQTLNFVWGPGGNGKSVFIDALMDALGDYAATAPMDTFASTKGDKHPTDLAGLMGARLVTATETQHGRSWDEQRLKAITGGDRMRARFMRQDFVEFTPRFKLILVGNHEPQIESVDDAMRRRIHIVPFTFKPDEPDLRLPEKLREESGAILSWMIEGCLRWQTEGLEPPASVLARTEQYFEEEDLMGQWLEDCCEVTGDGADEMSSADAFRSWQIWCGERNEFAGTRKVFSKAMRTFEAKHPIKKASVGGRRLNGWKGVRLTNDETIHGDLT